MVQTLIVKLIFSFLFSYLTQPYIEEIFSYLKGKPFKKFLERYTQTFIGTLNRFINISNPFVFFSEKFTRFCQWKNLELNIQVSVR